MSVFYINPPLKQTNGETAYFLTMFINRQNVAPELEATCHNNEIQIASGEGITRKDVAKVVAAFAAEMEQDGTPDQISEARELVANLEEYLYIQEN